VWASIVGVVILSLILLTDRVRQKEEIRKTEVQDGFRGIEPEIVRVVRKTSVLQLEGLGGFDEAACGKVILYKIIYYT
jgi:hypothetical protein